MSDTSNLLIFTDLDGSLLGHHNYKYAEAQDYLAELETANVPVIFTTSKTRSEVIELRSQLANKHPFIVENGAGIIIPKDYPIQIEQALTDKDGYLVMSFGRKRDHWLGIISSLKIEFTGCFAAFSELSVEEISGITGLHQDSARMAADRDYGEPVLWKGSDSKLVEFKSRLAALGATVVSGGRFLHVSDDVSKGKALQWLAKRYAVSGTVITVAVGDSENDVAMLEAADHAVIVKSAIGPGISVSPRTNKQICYTQSVAPLGWVEGVSDIIDRISFPVH